MRPFRYRYVNQVLSRAKNSATINLTVSDCQIFSKVPDETNRMKTRDGMNPACDLSALNRRRWLKVSSLGWVGAGLPRGGISLSTPAGQAEGRPF